MNVKSSLLLIIVFILSFSLQQIMYFNHDVSWLLEASRRLLYGGSYTNDFFENNPPLILYLYLPAVLLKETTHIHIMVSLQIYVYGLIALSLYMCNKLCRKIFTNGDNYLIKPVILSIATILLIVINRDFGQREHLLLILTLPYMLLVLARLKNASISPVLAITIGVTAASGFFLKPYFLFALCLIEFYYMIKTRNWQSWSRLEIRAMLVVLLVYLTIVLFRHSDYLTFVMPYAVRWCGITDHMPLQPIIDNVFVGLFIFTGLTYLYQRRTLHCHEYTDIMMLTTLAYIAVFILEATLWTYHLYPALSCLLLTLIYIFVQRVTYRYDRRDYVIMSILFIMPILLLFYFSVPIWTTSVIYKNSYLFFFPSTFSLYILLYYYLNEIDAKKIKITFLAMLAITLVSMIALNIINESNWTLYQFVIVTIITLSLLSLLISKVCKPAKEHIITFLAAVTVFALPFYMVRSYIDRSINFKNGVSDVIAFIQHEAVHVSVYIFTMEVSYAFPIISYGHETTSASRFSHFFGLGGMIKKHQLDSGDSLFLTNMVAEDIETKKPDFVLVDNRKATRGELSMINGRITGEPISFSYLDYFNKNLSFNKVWKHYAFIKKINHFDIYKRIS